MKIVVTCNPTHLNYEGWVLANGLEFRAKAELPPNTRIVTEELYQPGMHPEYAVNVLVTADDTEGLTNLDPKKFAEYLGEWLNEMIDGELADMHLIIQVTFGGRKGVWER